MSTTCISQIYPKMIGVNEIYFYSSVTGYRLARIYPRYNLLMDIYIRYTLRVYILGIAEITKFTVLGVYLGYT